MSKFINLPLILIITIFLFLSTSLLLDEPFVWPDEAIYGDIARNIMLEGRMGTDLWKGLIDGIENHAYSLPPLFLYASAVWFKIFGFSITTQRLMSVFLASIFIVIFYNLVKKLLSSKKKLTARFLPFIATLMLAVDSVFLKASRLGRPEILVLVLAGGAMLLFLRSLDEKTQRKQNILLFLTGLSLGIAVITHLIATCFLTSFLFAYIYTQKKHFLSFKKYYLFILGIFIPIAGWLISIYPNYQYLINQLSLVSNSRNYTIPWYINVINFPILPKLNYLFYLFITLSFVVYTIKTKLRPHILLSLILILTWGFATLGDIYWYTIYAIPFVYLALFILVNETLKRQSRTRLAFLVKVMLAVICFFLIYSNLTNYENLYNLYKNSNSYNLFRKQIAEAIPEGKTVYLSSIPDAYYAFNIEKNNLLEYPALFSDMEHFKKVLLEVDYIVFNGMYIPNPGASVYLDKFITMNMESAQELSNPYPVLIIKLKDKHLRSGVE